MDWKGEFKVIKQFRDTENPSKVWKVNEPYIRTGEGKKARIEALAGTNNKVGYPVIQEIPKAEEEGDS